MSTASNGRAREYRVRDQLVGHGWTQVMRSAGSKGAGDLLMGRLGNMPLLVQVGTAKSKSLGPGDRERFCHAAELIQGIPVLARTHRAGTRFHLVTRTPESTWTEWTP